MKKKIIISLIILTGIFSVFYFFSKIKNDNQIEEQISINTENNQTVSNDSLNSVTGNVSMNQVSSFPNKVILTGLNEHRLISIYKSKKENTEYSSKLRYNSNEEEEDEIYTHFMPGIDILYGYNLLNIAHYDFFTEKVNYLFNNPVLIKTLYYPSFIQDSINLKPINRNFYLISVYDEDTNKDTLINKKDLRKFYHFDAKCISKTQIIPNDFSVIRSQYDIKNDIMYIFASKDENKNGTHDKSDPIHVFWFSMKLPQKAKLLY
jgi:hypothetical protein